MPQDPEEFYTKLNLIGSGSFGDVYKGVNKQTREFVAIKIIDLDAVDDEIVELQKEIAILSDLDSKYITKYIGSFIKETQLWIVMEFLGGGSLANLLKAGTFEEKEIAVVTKEVLCGLEYMHSQKKIHRDIKAANIFLSTTGEVKLGDFGVSGRLTDTLSKRNTFVGTPFWMAPEIILHQPHSYSADIWSLGITCIELAEGKPPRSHLHPYKVLFEIPKANPPTLSITEKGPKWSSNFQDFIALCLKKDPERRPPAKELQRQPFIRNAKKLVILQDVLERYETYKASLASEDEESSNELEGDYQGTLQNDPEWTFDTIKAALPQENFDTIRPIKASDKKYTSPSLLADTLRQSRPFHPCVNFLIGFLEKTKTEESNNERVCDAIDQLLESLIEVERRKPGFSELLCKFIKDTSLPSNDNVSEVLLDRWVLQD